MTFQDLKEGDTIWYLDWLRLEVMEVEVDENRKITMRNPGDLSTYKSYHMDELINDQFPSELGQPYLPNDWHVAFQTLHACLDNAKARANEGYGRIKVRMSKNDVEKSAAEKLPEGAVITSVQSASPGAAMARLADVMEKSIGRLGLDKMLRSAFDQKQVTRDSVEKAAEELRVGPITFAVDPIGPVTIGVDPAVAGAPETSERIKLMRLGPPPESDVIVSVAREIVEKGEEVEGRVAVAIDGQADTSGRVAVLTD